MVSQAVGAVLSRAVVLVSPDNHVFLGLGLQEVCIRVSGAQQFSWQIPILTAFLSPKSFSMDISIPRGFPK